MVFSVLFLLMAIGQPTLSDHKSKDLGVWFVRQGSVLLTGDRWRIIVSINATEICQGIGELRAQVEAAQATWMKASVRVPELEVYKEFLNRLINSGLQLEEAGQALKDLLPSGRPRRGLMNLGGKVMRMLFGTAEQEDVEHLERTIEHLKGQTAEIVHLQHEHVTVTRQLSRRTQANTVLIRQLAARFSEEAEAIGAWANQVNQKISKDDTLLQITVNITTKLQDLELAVMTGLLELRNLLLAIENVSRNKFSVGLITPYELGKLLVKVQTSLPRGLGLLEGPDQSYHYYRLAQTRAISVDGIIKILVDLPLTEAGRRFELFQAHSIPVADQTNRLATHVHLHQHHLLISEDRQRYAEPTQELLAQCLPGEVIICPAQLPVFKSHQLSCLSALFLEDSATALQLCPRTALLGQPPDTWIWDGPRNMWIYSVATSERLVSHCWQGDKTTVTQVDITGLGEVKATAGCTLSTNLYDLLPTTRAGGDLELPKRVLTMAAPLPMVLQLPRNTQGPPELQKLMSDIKQEGPYWRGTSGLPETTLDNIHQRLADLDLEAEAEHTTIILLAFGGGLLAVTTCAILLYWRGSLQLPWRSHKVVTTPTPGPSSAAEDQPAAECIEMNPVPVTEQGSSACESDGAKLPK
ncbi:uncharacterized protein LOC120354909 [Nilaparvata lugens]|uniref:uncharacterized protein LOC120354909 n=1 Tax=Nilaparvata lugens TaxID=108931 RepID=UPI00193D2C85|nr:uncharacterized protein LOC120354909 [Nilaparvata lugens]